MIIVIIELLILAAYDRLPGIDRVIEEVVHEVRPAMRNRLRVQERNPVSLQQADGGARRA